MDNSKNENERISNKNSLKSQTKKLGGKLIIHNNDINIKDNKEIFKDINILLIDIYEKDNQIIQFFKDNKKKILFSNYINICYMFYYKIDYDDFELNEDKKVINFIDLVLLFNKHKDRIIEFYKSKLDKK